MFFNFERYDLSEVGRYKFNQRLSEYVDPKEVGHILTLEDLVAVVKEIIRLSNTQGEADDIDHLANRRIRAAGELIQTRYRVGGFDSFISIVIDIRYAMDDEIN
jgi:DNA-directed RNA polymerase subunit beta